MSPLKKEHQVVVGASSRCGATVRMMLRFISSEGMEKVKREASSFWFKEIN